MASLDHDSPPIAPLPDTPWRQALKEKKFILSLAITLIYLIILAIFTGRFLPYINARPGTQLHNLWIEYLPAYDLSSAIFVVIYLSLLATLLYVLNKPKAFLRFLAAMALMYTFRNIALYFVPLEPPVGCIPLTDPLVKWLAYGGQSITKDLFFSGHTACLFICVLVVRKKYLEIALCVALIAVAVMLIFQHAHYFIDIAGAFLITPICWVLSGRILPFSYPLSSHGPATKRPD